MLSKTIWLCLFALIACGKKDSSSPKPLGSVRPPITPSTTVTPSNPLPQAPMQMNRREFVQIAPLLPTMYYVPKESNVSCEGRYGGTNFSGREKSEVKDPQGVSIATVCTRFYRHLLMEGTAILSDRGQGEIAVNYGGIIAGERRYHRLGRCVFGEGIKRDLCLLPYHTIAADNKVHKVGEIVFIPKAEGLALPDGTIHDGFFIVRDTGGAFNGVGAQRVDLFTGLDPDYNNVFLKAGFNHTRPMDAYKVQGESAEFIKKRLEDRFGELY